MARATSELGANSQLSVSHFVIIASVIASSVGFSQTADAAYNPESNGILIGDTRVHPSLNVGSHYHSNPYLMDADDPDNKSDIALTIQPGLDVELSNSTMDLFLAAGYQYRHYTEESALTAHTGELTSNVVLFRESAGHAEPGRHLVIDDQDPSVASIIC